jgi:hypothetical protein
MGADRKDCLERLPLFIIVLLLCFVKSKLNSKRYRGLKVPGFRLEDNKQTMFQQSVRSTTCLVCSPNYDLVR